MRDVLAVIPTELFQGHGIFGPIALHWPVTECSVLHLALLSIAQHPVNPCVLDQGPPPPPQTECEVFTGSQAK